MAGSPRLHCDNPQKIAAPVNKTGRPRSNWPAKCGSSVLSMFFRDYVTDCSRGTKIAYGTFIEHRLSPTSTF